MYHKCQSRGLLNPIPDGVGRGRMKNQYFGDINDYRKYGLLRALTGKTGVSATVGWMLTESDGRGDGALTGYLRQPGRWRSYDAPLFDFLCGQVAEPGQRDVARLALSGLLAGCRFFGEKLPGRSRGRGRYFDSLLSVASGTDLIFLDPDNGIEVSSVQWGQGGSSRYIYWHEMTRLWAAGHSLLVYQHFLRVYRRSFLRVLASDMASRLGSPRVYSYQTPHVAFLLAPKEAKAGVLVEATWQLLSRWRDQFVAFRHDARGMFVMAPGILPGFERKELVVSHEDRM